MVIALVALLATLLEVLSFKSLWKSVPLLSQTLFIIIYYFIIGCAWVLFGQDSTPNMGEAQLGVPRCCCCLLPFGLASVFEKQTSLTAPGG